MIDINNPVVQKMFQQPNQTTIQTPLGKGSLVMFFYSFWKHDPSPLLIITDYQPGNRIRGINLHYLTFPIVKNSLSMSAGNPSFSYQNIKGNNYIQSAFRTYKWAGISQLRRFDSKFVLQMMDIARTFDPYQIKAIREAIDQQLARTQPVKTAEQTQQQGEVPLTE